MNKKWRKAFQEDLERDAEQIMKEVNSDPNLKDVKAPEGIHTRLMNQIHGDRIAEEKELISLGRIYKKRKKQTRYVAVAAAMVAVFALGITSLGGPERIIQTMKSMIGEREQTRVNTEGDQITGSGISDEEKAYQKIKETFGVEPVRSYVIQTDMYFVDAVIEEETQNARLYYESEKNKKKTIGCYMWFNYTTGSVGMDVEDPVLEEYERNVDGNVICVKRYDVGSEKITRWSIEFQYQKVHYFMGINGFSESEVEEIIKNLHFF